MIGQTFDLSFKGFLLVKKGIHLDYRVSLLML